MATRRQMSGFLLAATLVAGACGGGDDGSSTAATEPTEATAPVDAGDEAASARLSSVELVWAFDGEPVGPDFDYDELIDRDRYDAGLRFDAVFETTGDVGDITTDLFLPITINDDKIDAGSTIGPERSPTRPNADDIVIVTTDDGFNAQFPIGRPLSPISLVDSRRSAVEAGLGPDDEVVDLGAGQTLNAAALNDFPAAPQNGRNEFLIDLAGTVEFGNGFVIEVGEDVARSEIGERLTISETPTVSVSTIADCATQTARYLELLDEELAEPDVVLLDRLRAFERIVDITRDNDCNPRDFALPVCDAAIAATAPESLLARHLQICPDEREAVEATVFEPRFEDGVVRLVVPATIDGLPAYSIAISWPAWTVETTSEGSNRQKIALSADPDTVGRFTRLDIDVSAMPASLLQERATAVVEPEVPDAEIVLADTTTIGGVPARRLIARVEPDAPVYEVGTAVEIDSERLLTITGVVTGTEELPVDGDGLAALMVCIETSMVIVEYDPDSEPAPAGDCTSITELATGVAAPGEESIDPGPSATGSATFDGTAITLAVPGAHNGPAHTVTVSVPAWDLDDARETEGTQFVQVEPEEAFTFVNARGGFILDYADSADKAAEPFDEDWVIVSDETRSAGGRELRIVESESEFTGGRIARKGKIITELDEQHILVVEVNIGLNGPYDFDAIFAAVLDSLTITP